LGLELALSLLIRADDPVIGPAGLMPVILVSLFISRGVDMHQETHQPMLEALFRANADLAGLIITLTAAACLYYGLLFIRRKWAGKKTS
jgi:hypothetical protein